MLSVYSRASLFFITILLLLSWGFYKTYLIFFPTFKGFQSIQHIHGILMLTWMLFLIIQPLLIRAGKNHIHRIIGKISYLIAPLILVSIFLSSKMVYQRTITTLPEQEAVGLIALSIPPLLAFGMIYLMAIINKRNTDKHMRYMIGTSFLLIGPGLGRALIVYYNYSLNDAVNISDYLIIGIAAGMVIYDLMRKKSPTANMVVLLIILLMHTAWALRYTELSQAVWGQFAKMFF